MKKNVFSGGCKILYITPVIKMVGLSQSSGQQVWAHIFLKQNLQYDRQLHHNLLGTLEILLFQVVPEEKQKNTEWDGLEHWNQLWAEQYKTIQLSCPLKYLLSTEIDFGTRSETADSGEHIR